MNLLTIVMAIILGGLPLGDASDDVSAHEANVNGQMCITADKLIRPTRTWKVLKTEIKYQDKLPFMEVSVHNPLNKKTPQSVDAKFILSIDPVTPADVQKYNLIMAIYYNEKTNVTFKRIYSVHDVVVKDKKKKFPMQTPCFAREVLQIIEFDPTEVKIMPSTPDGGTK